MTSYVRLMSVWLGLDFWPQYRRFSESWYRDFRWFMVRLQWNWKILLFLRPRLVKMMRRRLYPESCWSLCCHATHYHEIWIVWGCDLGGQVIQIPTTILTQASALQSLLGNQLATTIRVSCWRGGDTLWMSLNTLAVFR